MKKVFALLLIASFGFVACSSEKANQSADDAAQMAEKKADDAAETSKQELKKASTLNVMDTLAKTGDHSTLIAAIEAAGLADTLRSGGTFTLFAPNDAAFQKLPPAAVEDLLKAENKEALVKILTLHVVNGKVVSGDLTTSDVATINGESVPVVVDESGVAFGPAKVVEADIDATNGVIHSIDAVVFPAEGGDIAN